MVYNAALTPAPLPSDCVGKQDFVKLDTGFGVPASGPRAGFPNGLGTPRGIDVDGNGTIDYAYAGDTLGNFFRFDMTSADFSEWTVTKIFEAKYVDPATATETPQPITTQPIVIQHPTEPDGYIVIFGTGSYITDADGTNEDVQSLYGIWDRLGPELITKDDLVEQNYENRIDATFGNVRVLSDNAVDYSVESRRKGWFIDLDPPAAGGTQDVDPPEFPGEKAIRNIQMRGGIAFVNSVIPRSNTSCTSQAGGFALAFCPGTGGTTCLEGNQIFDLNNDGVFDSGDETGGDVVAATRFEDAVPTDSTFIGESRVTQLSDQSLDASLTNTAGGINTGRLSWKQLPTVE
jgi:type IV pilus assembly protein PilY1